MAEIELRRLRKSYGKVVAINDVSLQIHDGEFLVLLGPSGCGKTTTLRAIAGLELLDRGRVLIGGRDVTDLPPGRRGIAMVFQSYAVFPHMRVVDNIAFGLRMKGVPPEDRRRRAQEAAELLQIADLLDRYPAQLSGGQRQRVAVARAIVMRPDVLLMDEPLSNLDALLRLHMRAELKRLHRELRATTVYVTHDQVEALSLGDRIAVMKDGAIVQCDTPAAIYDRPANRFVGGFIGSPPMNFLTARLRCIDGRPHAVVGGTAVPLPPGTGPLPAAGETVTVGIRPEHIAVEFDPVPGGVPAQVSVLEPLGSHQLLTAQVGAEIVKVVVPPEFAAEPGRRLWLRFDPARLRLMDPASGRALPVTS
ncbi:MAG: ABC transporter ATP-binding protein [Armatimonadota bacterium]|nr:ABC transporter ATP-binding protein [Armatimonadota bacterium]MDR7451235.1 ABC transporter ATP-binding protein [Armatimonadota bacterium]MDR7466862.1 ABC transporter ATP-binding protein [Armatimonadota bacterium]MDR7492665.1 ABC transporter ATP-binding protein [Armatimonadota bacterium]MDR7499973.1 ABC transporter ATP-binding protein [Armatimonadota bacterium]